MAQHVDDSICREAHLGEPARGGAASTSPEKTKKKKNRVSGLKTRMHGQREGGKRRTLGRLPSPGPPTAPSPPGRRPPSPVVMLRRRRCCHCCCGECASAKTDRGAHTPATGRKVRGTSHHPPVQKGARFSSVTRGNARGKEGVAAGGFPHFCPVSRRRFEPLPICQVVLCLPGFNQSGSFGPRNSAAPSLLVRRSTRGGGG